MKLIRIAASGLPLFKEDLDITFYARQRVNELDKEVLCPLQAGSRFYLNPAIALIGINASGKTTVLKVISLALDILNSQPINHSGARDVLGDATDAAFTIWFLSNSNELCQLKTCLSATGKGPAKRYCITEETLWVKPAANVVTKNKLTDFTGIAPYAVRSGNEEFLPEDTSIVIAYNKKNRQRAEVCSLMDMTDKNILPMSEDIPEEVIRFLDPTIERLAFDRKGEKVSIHLKFFGEEELLLSDAGELNRFLSSGTIKGIVTFTMAIRTLRSGGYLIVDELENHFNKEITATLMRFFMDANLNRFGGSLVFSTHYPEILDEFDRNDCIYITRNRDGITAENLTDILKRNDIKKSDAYQSGFLEGTVPAYEAYMRLKKNIRSRLEEGA